MKIITGYTGTAHITAADDQALNLGLVESADLAVLDIGSKFAATAVGMNTVRISDGVGYLHGVGFRVEYGSYDDVSIASCTSGYKRIDLICAHYERDTQGIESMSWKVIQGTETTGTPALPTGLDDGEPYQGGGACDAVMYVAYVAGTSYVSLTESFTVWKPVSKADEVADALAALSGFKLLVSSTIASVDVPALSAFQQGAKITASVTLPSEADYFEAEPVDGGRIISNGFSYSQSAHTVSFWPYNAASSSTTDGNFRYKLSFYKTL